ncbi:hypothetical protein PG995_007616 [Apiospora arundinis]
MGERGESNFIATCTSLAQWAESGSREIDGLLGDSTTATPAAAPPQYGRADHLRLLWPLSGILRQLRDEANRVRIFLEGGNTPMRISPRLQTVFSAHLTECDATGAVIAKQLMRLSQDTPPEAINPATVQQYESFVKAVLLLLDLFLRSLRHHSVVKQEEELENEDVKLLMIRIGSLCRAIGRSGSILHETPSGRLSSSSKDASFDSLPPSYEASQPFQDSAHQARNGSITSSATASHQPSSSISISKDRSSAGFMGFFSKPFRAATDALRPKPEPLVAPLCQAATYGSVAQLKFLLAEGANINGRDEEGQTALIRAIAANQLGTLEYLLQSGADHAVCDSGTLGSGGKPPLFHAIDAENGGAIDLLLEYGASANQRHEWGEPYFASLIRGATPLTVSRGGTEETAARRGRGRPRGGGATAPPPRGESGHAGRERVPLIHLCMTQKRDGLVRHLLEVGADPSVTDINGTPLLVTAVKQHDVALVQMLLEHGADANANDIYLTHILLVVFEDNKLAHADKMNMMELLLRHGSKPQKARNSWNVTLLEKALEAFLAAVDTDRSSAAEDAVVLLEIPELLLKHGADPNQRLTTAKKTRDGKQAPTLLTYAAEQARSWELAELALRYGADANLADDDADRHNRTPLALAARSGDRGLVELLLEKGARVERGALSGPGPVMETVVRSGNNTPEIVRLLKA